MSTPNSLKPTEAVLQVSPANGVNYRGSSIVMLAALAIVGCFLTCGWYIQSQIALVRGEIQVARTELRIEMSELRMLLMQNGLTPRRNLPQ